MVSSSRRDSLLSQTNNLPLFSLQFWSYDAARIQMASYTPYTISCSVVDCFLFRFLPPKSFATPTKSLKVAQTNLSVRPRFHIWSDAFSIPPSTPKHPPCGLPDPTRRVSDRLGSLAMSRPFPPKYHHCPIIDHAVTHVVTSSWPSSIVLMSREHE